jgi:structural maintenance of chromosome 2
MLNGEKEKELKKCWKIVNENFRKIFGTLLKGAQAKLEPVNPENISEGLTMRVAFSGAQISSLNGLSGG